ncbi:MAG: hypothetical protein NZ108_08725, partial [Bacteroidia bacterium]|nr:hypothetical protein [Bacteroidia bacterium]
ILGILLVFFYIQTHAESISIIYPESSKKNSIIQNAVQDFEILLRKSGIQIDFNQISNAVTIEIPDVDSLQTTVDWKVGGKLDGFSWIVLNTKNQLLLRLSAQTPKGVANGLYSLLQDGLKFQFYHPRATIIPKVSIQYFYQISSYSAKPIFPKIGFHLHTMHPTELTEYLLNDTVPGAIEAIQEYVLWLARNGQNYFEFNLLESINKKTWIIHAQKFIQFAKQRGIYCGVDLSLRMLQQKAFQLYVRPPKSFLSAEKQVFANAQWLVQAGFDLWNVELSATEFSAGNQKRKSRLLEILQQITKENGIVLMSRVHVVKPTEMVGRNKENEYQQLNKNHGLMVHTVMFYTLTDEVAPVYRNKNLKFLHELLKNQKLKREVWYYPESAYWVSFDNSIPLFLLPYLTARLTDIQTCEQEGIQGHLTFSSGWEWGYWLIDWSIARWCWTIYKQGIPTIKTPTQFAELVIQNRKFLRFFQNELQNQQSFIKDKQLIRVLDAQTVTDEIPGSQRLEFQPRPVYPYSFIRNRAGLFELEKVK